jgi:hypothetical protein
MNIIEKIKAAQKVFVWVDTHEDGSGIFVKADKRDLMRTVKQNMDHIDPTRFRITKEVIGLNRLLFIH